MEIGRVAYIAFGPDAGKLVAIVDVINQNRVPVLTAYAVFGEKSSPHYTTEDFF